jgi:hypothetical protein
MDRLFWILGVVGGCLGVGMGLSGPVRAKPRLFGGSSCAEPPAAIPETQRQAIEAEVSAQVQGVQGGAQANQEQETHFQVSGFSSEGYEGAWYAYFMCKQKESGLISEAQYASFLASNGLTAPVEAAPASTPAPPPTPTATPLPKLELAGTPVPASTVRPLVVPKAEESAGGFGEYQLHLSGMPPSPVGVWNVQNTFLRSTCPPPNDTAGESSYLWLISTDAQGNYTVAVQGSTGYPSLTGYLNDRLILTGIIDKGLENSTWRAISQSWFSLEVSERTLSGDRLVSMIMEIGEEYIQACTIQYAIQGTRQGG